MPSLRFLIVFDVLVAAVTGAVVTYAAADTRPPTGLDEPLWVAVLAAVLIAGPIAVRRLWPVPALGVSLGATAVTMASGLVPVVAMGAPVTAVAIVLYFAAAGTTRRTAWLALAVCLAVATAVMLTDRLLTTTAEDWEDSLFGISFGWLLLTTAWALGWAAGERRRYTEELAERRTHEAVAEERLRIARELHDIVAHSMSLIAVQAGIGNHVAAARPAEAREALRVIEATSRGSLTEMRHLLGVLRSEVDDADLAPAPGPGGIPELVERARSAGVTVTLRQDEAALPGGIGLSVYRIVQEALTNVVKHAAPARCGVTVAVTDEHVAVEVTNDGPPIEPAASGHGLIGMRERVSAVLPL